MTMYYMADKADIFIQGSAHKLFLHLLVKSILWKYIHTYIYIYIYAQSIILFNSMTCQNSKIYFLHKYYL